MEYIKMNGKIYRQVHPGSHSAPMSGRWEWYWEKQQRWMPMINWQLKSELNRIINNRQL